MKKGNKVLALFLAAVMLATSIAWDFGEVKAETTEEITSQIETKEDGVSINFDNIDVAELDANGYVSTKFKGGEAVQGEVNQPVSKHWFSGDGDDTPYGDGGTIKSKNIGLKTKETESVNTRTFMYTPYSYEDFQVSAEIYYGAYSGIVLGEKNVYPTEDGTSSSVALFFNSGRIHIMGAVKRDTATIMRGTSAAIANNGSALGYKIFNNSSGDAIAKDAGATYTVNVKKTGNHLLVWISGGAGLMTIELADTYKTGWIGIQSKCFDSDGGGFKTLDIEKVHAVEHHELENVSLTELDDAGYSYTFSNNKILNKASDAIKSVDGILKGITTGTSMSSLNIPYLYKNFRFEAEIYPEQAFGVAMGKIGSVPLDGTGLVCAYFNASQLEIRGAITATGATASGGGTGTVDNASRYKLDSYDKEGKKYVRNSSQLVTIVVEVKDNKVTAWLEDYDGYVEFPITTSYAPEKISLIGRSAGGFKSYTITNLDAGDCAEFDNVNLTNLEAAGYTASDCEDSSLTDKKNVKDVWFSGQSRYAASEANKNNGLKPSDTDDFIDLLNLPEVYENFRLKTTMYHGQVVGVAFGKKGVKPTASSGGDNGLVTIYTNSKYVELTGSINKSSANLTAGGEVTSNSNLYHYVPVGFSANWNKEITLVVEVQDGILTVWMEGYEGVLRVRLTDKYDTENIALIARRNNTSGNPGGGLKSYTIEKLPATNNINTTVDVAGHTDFDFVDTTVLDEKGFSVSQFNIDGTAITTDATVGAHMYAGEVGVSVAGKVAYNKEYPNIGLKSKAVESEGTRIVLNTPYTATNGYEDFSASLEVYWGSETGIILGTKNVLPAKSNSSVMIYFNSNQLQVTGGGIEPSSAVVKGGTGYWNVSYDPTFIFRPAEDFTPLNAKGEVFDLNVELKDGTLTVWVEGYDSVLSLNTTTAFTHDTVALTAKKYDGDGGGFKNFTIESLEGDIVREYDATDFASFRSTAGHTAPEYKNYLFAGWFTDKACTKETAITSGTLTIEEGTTVFAKFVPRYILTVKAQVSADLVDETMTTEDGEGEIRFATTVDTQNYSKVGFQIAYDKDRDGVDTVFPVSNKTVYSSLKAFGTYTYAPTDFCRASEYFKACTVKQISSEYFDVEFKVTPFWNTMDGTEVKGDTVVKTINQGISVENLAGKSALFVGDSIQDGGNYSSDRSEAIQYRAWFDRLARYYGMTTKEVAQKDASLTNSDVSGKVDKDGNPLQVALQLNDDTLASAYDFVLLEGGVNDVLVTQSGTAIDWGTIDEDSTKADYGDVTIAGAMQSLIKKAQTKYGEAKIVYIINHYFGATDANMKKYVAMVKEACRVHDISYVDLSDTDAYPSLESLEKKNNDYLKDGIHPTAAGYELTTPIIADHLRKMITGEITDTVYVSDSGTDAVGYGTEVAPYQTLNYAIEAVEDGGTVYITDTCTVTNETAWKEHDKAITISGTQANKASVLQAAADMPRFCIEDATTFTNLTFKLLSTSANAVFAEGHAVTIAEDVNVSGVKEIYGGSRFSNVESTNLKLYAGTYEKIFAGTYNMKVTGDTHVTVGGTVNQGISSTQKWKDHTHVYKVYGGSDTGVVSGNTYVTVEDGAEFIYVFGGGRSAASQVLGSTNVLFGGKAVGVNGGAYKGQCVNTNVKMIGGEAEQIFGGSEFATISGNTNVEILGGTIKRRVFGGCYNEDGKDTAYYANGTVTVTIAPEANLALNTGNCQSLAAISRKETPSSSEKGIFIFTDYTNNSKNIEKIGIDSVLTDWYGFNSKTHDNLVKVGANGTVKVVDGKLVVTPNSGYTIASVTGANVNDDGTYTLLEKEVIVTFVANN